MSAPLDETAAQLTEHRIKVLLIDDQPIVGADVKNKLADQQDIDFHFITDPTKAIATATELQPTVILQDLVMPDIDGLTLVKFMRANAQLKDIPLIVLSSKEEAVTKAEAFALGANDYLVKGTEKIELVARIRYHSRAYINYLQRNEAFRALQESQEALKKELARAADYVISLLPKPMEEAAVKTDWRFIPSTSLGGDSFGYLWLDDDNFAIFLLDVCDHGVGSALLSVSAMNVLTSQSLPDTDFLSPSQVLTGLNNAFQMDKQNNLYFTIWYGVFNKSSRTLTYASGGHPPALLMTGEPGDGAFTELRTKNLFIGGMPDMAFAEESCVVDLPSRLFVYSDGVYELKKESDGTMWEFSDFAAFMAGQPETGASPMDALIGHARSLQGYEAFEDDFSIVEITFKP